MIAPFLRKMLAALLPAALLGLVAAGCQNTVPQQFGMQYPAQGQPYYGPAPGYGPQVMPPLLGNPRGSVSAYAGASRAPAVHAVSYQTGNGPPNAKAGGQMPAPLLPGNGALPGNGMPPPPNGYGVSLDGAIDPGPIPTELNLVSHPPYTVAAPDILIIDAFDLVPRPPYRIQPLDVLTIQVKEAIPGEPIQGKYVVTPDGTVNLGFSYGSVQVAGLTLRQAEDAIRRHLSQAIRNPQVIVGLEQFRALQQVRGQHLIRPDGTISLGPYGAVYVNGLTLAQVKYVIEKHLSQYVLDPKISVDVFAYNSKKYFVITDGGGYGQLVFAFPYTGNETVLDAISKINGLPAVASKKYIWVARPAPAGHPCSQILPVDWRAITEAGQTTTNYQLLPGDRVFVKADCLIAADNYLAKVLAPVERVLGVTLLGSATVNSIRNTTNNGNGVGFIAVP